MTRILHKENIGIKNRKIQLYNNCKRWRKYNQISLMYSRAKSSAKRKGIEFTISKNDIVIPEYCPLLGVKFTNTYLNPDENRDYVPSLDRINNLKGYTPDNIWVISFKANRMKNTATLDELKVFCERVKDIIKFD